MSRDYFEPVGKVARWRTIYELLAKLDVNETLTYPVIGEALEIDHVRDRMKIAGAMRRAAQELLEQNNRAVEVVPNVGYRTVATPEQLRLAKRYQRKAGKALKSGHSQVIHFDPTGLDPNVKAGFELLAYAFKRQAEFNDRLMKRDQQVRADLDSIKVRSERTDEELAAIQARLDRLEGRDERMRRDG